MSAYRTLLAAAAAVVALSFPLAAEDLPEGIQIQDPYARAMGGMGKSGAVFFVIQNNTGSDDRLIDARADVAKKVELHTHKDDGQGIMQMLHVPEGFAIASGESHALARGGDHVMLMGLTRDLAPGEVFPLTLVFEQAGEVIVEVPLDNDRKPAAMGAGMGNMGGNMGGAMGNGMPGQKTGG